MTKLFYGLLNIIIFISLVFAQIKERNDCNKIRNYIEYGLELDSADIINECSINDFGVVTNLNIYDYYDSLTEKNIIKIINFKSIKYLTIQNVKLTQNIIKVISNISNLLYLEIEKCEFNEKDINILKKHGRLNTLYLDSNNDYKIGKNALSGFMNLKKIILDGIAISQDNINEISSLPKISNVKLSFSTVTDSIDFKPIKENRRITTLEILHINGGNLKGGFFEGFTNVKRLVFAWMNLTQENINDIANLTKLREITFFECNNYDKINFDPLNQLKYITVFKVIGKEFETNPIKEIPDVVYSFNKLKKITITHQSITSIPEEIVKLNDLEYIDLCYNNLFELPDFLNSISKLNYVNFKANNNLKGQVLTNGSLNRCFYDEDNDFLCIDPESNLKCLKNYYLNECSK
ncbi:L domain-like protein [Piromyces finnis]|uniref:L domain-like protein n=1 Tax=Piromyces finnis TaxID=1754191 RepID=A0A1Y1VP53_9FUNG|nr:L domain-like protein [Piromyces finnis]|eukprot:ORX61199.1 L domain-like protein [Piromyces finnis]